MRRRRIAAAIIIITGLFAALCCLLPLRTTIEIGGDEGFELAKVTSQLSGFRLYEEVWNDQPPLHTALISLLMAGRLHAQGGQMSPLLPRLVSVFFGMVLIVALFTMAERVNGSAVAVVACLTLICSPGFLGLSASCMLEIPSLATAIAAMAMLVRKKLVQDDDAATPGNVSCISRFSWSSFRPGLIAAGAVFGCAAMMKLLPLMLLPIFGLVIFLSAHSAVPASSSVAFAKSMVKNSLFQLLIFCLASAVTFVLVDFLIDRGAFLAHFTQTWTSHFGPQKSFEYGSASDHPLDWSILWKHWDATLPALAGAILVARELKRRTAQRRAARETSTSEDELRTRMRSGDSRAVGRNPFSKFSAWIFSGCWTLDAGISLLPFLWLAYSLLVSAVHRPWWPYYYVHIAVPLTWCAAIGLVSMYHLVAAEVTRLKHRAVNRSPAPSRENPSPHRVFAVSSGGWMLAVGISLFLLSAAAWSVARVATQIATIRHSPQIYSDLVLHEIARFKPFTKFLFSDEPTYSFYSGIPLPPNLTVLVYKRFWSGDMTNEKLTQELTRTKPGLILLKNDTRALPYQALLQTEYRLVYYDSAHRLYAERSIANKPLP